MRAGNAVTNLDSRSRLRSRLSLAKASRPHFRQTSNPFINDWTPDELMLKLM